MRVFETIEELSEAAAEEFVRCASSSVAERDRFVVALSGGSTPKRLFALLASEPWRDRVEWSKVVALFGDERFVPPTDDMSNEKMARESLLDHVPIPAGNVLPMVTSGALASGPAAAAADYERRVRGVLGEDLAIDLVLLGLGPDGHTASLFPGDPSVHEAVKLVVASVASANTRDRITMTPALINRARKVLFLIAGKDKTEPLTRLLHGEIDFDKTPSQAIGRVASQVDFYVDRLAAGAS